LCQKSENYGYECLKNYAELYLINLQFSHYHRNLTVTKFVTACMSVTFLLLSCMTVIFGRFHKNFEKQLWTLSFLPVCVSAWNNTAFMGQIFMKFDNCVFFKSVKKIQVSLKSDKNNRYFTWRLIYILYLIFFSSSKNEKCFRQKL